ncbi:unnamed protein product [Cuscuta epithymum]|uniref:Ferredoxin thioredoxin reductase alpha chain domain-containing protein n=1 Tax=Cuscuta epithymum TaxID=186058 RepID=A0AAV0EGR0_9ASTE|nr:unnamed protein product [Cuscuta epithymum]
MATVTSSSATASVLISSRTPSRTASVPISSRTPYLLISNTVLTSPHIIKFRTPNSPLLSVKCSPDSTTIVGESQSPAANSVHCDENLDESAALAMSKIGSRVRVTAPLKVYHVPKMPEFELAGRTGVFKQYVAVHKGKEISANLPYKVEFLLEGLDGRKGPLKFFAHLREDEFEFLD